MDGSTSTKSTSNEYLGVPNNMVKSWSMHHDSVIFQLDDGTMWMHGTLPKNNKRDSCEHIPRTEPIKLSWTGSIIHSGYYVVFKKSDGYYVVGNIPWTEKPSYTRDPVKIPIDGIVKIFPGFDWIYVCTKDQCYVAGSNDRGQLGINDKDIKWQSTFRKVEWYPVSVDTNQDWTIDLKLKDGKWYGLGLVDELHGFHYSDSFAEPLYTEDEWFSKTDLDRHLWYPRELAQGERRDEWHEHKEQNNGDHDLCTRCKFDVIDVNYMPKTQNDGTYRRFCLFCLDDMGKLNGKDKRRADYKRRCCNKRSFPKIQEFLTGDFEPLQKDLISFSKILTEFNIDDLIKAVSFENRLLVKRLIHDKLLDYFHPYYTDVRLLKEDKYETNEVPLEPNDLGYLDWRGCDISHKMNYVDLIDKVKNKDKVKVLNMWNSSHLRDNMDAFYKFVTNLPNLEILIIDHGRATNPVVKKIAALDNIQFIRSK